MNYHILHKTDAADVLLLFFNGWGMDRINSVSDFNILWKPLLEMAGFPQEYDIVQFYDYSEAGVKVDIQELAVGYNKVYLAAWSLGVRVSAELLLTCDISLEKAVAINGTLEPISDNYGLSPSIFRATIDNWSEQGRASFNRRMCRGKDNLELFEKYQPQRELGEQKAELIEIENRVTGKPSDYKNFFNLAIAGLQDKIFFSARQIAYWQSQHVEVMELDTGHFPAVQ